MTRRADRLFRIAELLRGRRLTTAQQLAEWLEVSPRTVYRDVRDLQLSGVPIEGEAGIGYRLARTASLPPLTFTADELTALAVGARMAESWGGAALASGARGALAKIAAAMPAEKRAVLERLAVFAPAYHMDHAFWTSSTRCIVPSIRGSSCALPTATASARIRSGASGRSGSSIGARNGPSARGAKCARTSAISTSRAWRKYRCSNRFPT